MKLNFHFILACLFFINILNFLDRGIIPGASEEFNQFIRNSGVRNGQDVYLGLLQSAFIIGYAIASLIFGHLYHFYSPFYLCTFGIIIWIVAIVSSGLSYYTGSFTYFFFSRLVSGVGEAAFQISIPPWISKYAPTNHRATYLSIFYTAIPTGTAIGYTYSAHIANSIGWQYCFFIEAVLMALFIPFLLIIAPMFPIEDTASMTQKHSIELSVDSRSNSIETYQVSNISKRYKPSIVDEFMVLLSTPIYLFAVGGYAAQTASMIGLSTFGSAFLIGLGYYDTETQSSSLFGLLVSMAGVLATPLGGYVTDYIIKRRKKYYEVKMNTGALPKRILEVLQLYISLTIITVVNFIGAILLCTSTQIYPKALFLTVIFFGILFVFLSSASINLGIMLSVPEKHRAFAIGISCLGLHAFGDVPSPIITGLIKDRLAPGCAHGDHSASPECRQDNDGLRLTMLCVCLWLFMCVFFMSLACILAYRKFKRCWHEEMSQRLLQVDSLNFDTWNTSISMPTTTKQSNVPFRNAYISYSYVPEYIESPDEHSEENTLTSPPDTDPNDESKEGYIAPTILTMYPSITSAETTQRMMNHTQIEMYEPNNIT